MKTKFYSLWAKATDKNGQDHYVTIVGRFLQEKVSETIPTEVNVESNDGKKHNGLLLTDYKFNNRTFVMARAICDPRDVFDVEKGKKIAKQRIKNGDTIGSIQSRDVTMLNADMCNLLVLNELRHAVDNIDSIINGK